MPNLGPTELIVILVIALLVFGPKRLPDLGRSVGRGLREFKKARDEVTGAIKLETKDLGLDAKELGLSKEDLDPNAPLTPAKPAAGEPAGADGSATVAAAAGPAIAAGVAAPTNGSGEPTTGAADAADTAADAAETTASAADAADTDSEPSPAAATTVVDPAAPPTDPALLGYDEEDEVLHGEVVDDEPAPLSVPFAPSAPRDADQA